MDLIDMGNRINFLIKEKNITKISIQNELAIAENTLTNIIKGKSKPAFDKLYKLSKILDVSMEYLITGEEPTESNGADADPRTELLQKNYNKLNDHAKKELDNYLEFLLMKDENLNIEVKSSTLKIG